jgi:predicted enzyme related to lactoylglutathione lyase
MADVSFILLYVENVAASEAFYGKILGRPAVESSPNFAMLPAAPGIMLGLWRRGDVAPPADTPGGGEIAITAESAADVAVTIARWQALGARVAQPPMKMDFGFTGVALDPDGHRLRVFAPAERQVRERQSELESSTL